MSKENLNRHERRRLRTRRQLMETTLVLLEEKGYEAVTIAMITEQADLGRGTFYIHFKDKDEVIWETLRERIHMMRENYEDKLQELSPDSEQFVAVLTAHFTIMFENRRMLRIALGEQAYAPLAKRLQAHLAESMLATLHTNHAFAATFRTPSEFNAQYLSGALLAVMGWWLSNPDAYTAQQMAEMFYQMTFSRDMPEFNKI